MSDRQSTRRSSRSTARRPAAASRKMGDEERKALWEKSVLAKAGQFKKLCDLAILLMLALVLAAHALPFVDINQGPFGSYRIRGWEIVRDLVLPYKGDASVFEEADSRYGEAPRLLLGVKPQVLYKRSPDGRYLTRGGVPEYKFKGVYPATVASYFILLLPIGAAGLILLYLLDKFVWMGRALPALSALYGFGVLGYIFIARMLTQGSWNALRYSSTSAWLMLLVPLFLVGVFSLLRLIVSQRWKRYAYAGLPIPNGMRPQRPAEPAGKTENPAAEAEQAEDAEDVEEADEAEDADEPASIDEVEPAPEPEKTDAG